MGHQCDKDMTTLPSFGTVPQSLRRTRFVCVSDTHNSTPKLPTGDVLIHAGDLTNQGSYQEVSHETNPTTFKAPRTRWLTIFDSCPRRYIGSRKQISRPRSLLLVRQSPPMRCQLGSSDSMLQATTISPLMRLFMPNMAPVSTTRCHSLEILARLFYPKVAASLT